MALYGHIRLLSVLLGTFLSFCLLLYECKKLDGYKFPVYSTELCPRNQTEWNERSSAINCTKDNGYLCFPNEKFTQLLEFCHRARFIWIQEGYCLYLNKDDSTIYSYSCSSFQSGCHNSSFPSYDLFEHPNCTSIGKGCFLAEFSCNSLTSATYQPESTEHIRLRNNNNNDGWILFLTTLGVFIPVCVIILPIIFCIKGNRICIQKKDEERDLEPALDCIPLIKSNERKNSELVVEEEQLLDKEVIDQWMQDDAYFVSTKAYEQVVDKINEHNMVMVIGHSGSGKSAIIQHIALEYRKLSWTVKQTKIENYNEIAKFLRGEKVDNNTLLVYNGPLLKSFEELWYNPWLPKIKQQLDTSKAVKILIELSKGMNFDGWVKEINKGQSNIVDIDSDSCKLTKEEKRAILNKYSANMNLSEKELCEIIEIEQHLFPLLCKLEYGQNKYQNTRLDLFKNPVSSLEKLIRKYRKENTQRYCALLLLVLFNNDLRIEDLTECGLSKKKLERALEICSPNERTSPFDISDCLDELKGTFVKKNYFTFHFYHDFLKEVITHVIGSDFPTDIIKYADIGFLRRRIRIGYFEECNDPLSITLNEKDERIINELVQRLFDELFGDSFLEVILNQCLRNTTVIQRMTEKIVDNSHRIHLLLNKKEYLLRGEDSNRISTNLFFSKIELVQFEKNVSALFVLIAFSHTDLALKCLEELTKNKIDFKQSSLFSAVCCNNSKTILQTYFDDYCENESRPTWGNLYPIHIVSVLHNFEILSELLKHNDKHEVNTKYHTDMWTPLTLAAFNDTQVDENSPCEIPGENRRNNTLQLLLDSGADINLCKRNSVSPLYLACQNGHGSTVQLLLSQKANIDLYTDDGSSPLYIASQNGHCETVNILLGKKAKVDLCTNDGSSPLFIACKNGHCNIVKTLLKHGADINKSREDGASPLFIACENGQVSTVTSLLEALGHKLDINACTENGTSPLYIAYKKKHTNIVKLLQSKGADMVCPLNQACKEGSNEFVQFLLGHEKELLYLCSEREADPLYTACKYGQFNTVKLLLSNGAHLDLSSNRDKDPLYIASNNGYYDIVEVLLNTRVVNNSSQENRTNSQQILSAFHAACEMGYVKIIQLLIGHGANINSCYQNGIKPLHIACKHGHSEVVQLLLNYSADINLCTTDGSSPLFIACQNGQNTIVQLLLKNGANINLCNEIRFSPLHIACQNGHDTTVQLLLGNEAVSHLCNKNGLSPLHIACQSGHDKIVQLLLSNVADNNIRHEVSSPIFIACQNGHGTTVDLLLKNGANINLCNKNGLSLLHIACKNGCDKIVQLLLSYSADINLCTTDGSSPLFIACQNGHNTIVQLLLTNGANVDLCNKSGTSPLHIACQNGYDTIVQLLLSNKADIHLCNERISSPLFIALQKGHDTTVDLLLRNGASAFHMANEKGYEFTESILPSHEATFTALLY